MTEQQPVTDEVLAAAVSQGDTTAFDELVRRYQSRMFSAAYRIVLNREDALDVTQDALLKAYRKIERWKPTGPFGAWLMRLTTNQALDHLRRRKRRPALSLSSFEQPENLMPAGDTTEQSVRGAEIERAVTAALSTLSDHQRAVFVMRHYDGLSLTDIAEALGCSDGSVKVHLFRALRKLRQALGDIEL